MQDILKRLREAKQKAEEEKQAKLLLETDLGKTNIGIAYAAATQSLKDAEGAVTQLKNQIQAVALVGFEADGEQNPNEWVTINLTTTLGYDKPEVEAFCLEYSQVMGQYVNVALRKRDFDRAIRTGGLNPLRDDGTPLVDRFTDVPKVIIRGDLSDLPE